MNAHPTQLAHTRTGMSDDKRLAWSVCEMAISRFRGHSAQAMGNLTSADLERITCQYIRADLYRIAFPDDPIGAMHVASGWTWNQAVIRMGKRVARVVDGCACVLPEQSCPTCIQAAAVVADAVEPDGFPF